VIVNVVQGSISHQSVSRPSLKYMSYLCLSTAQNCRIL